MTDKRTELQTKISQVVAIAVTGYAKQLVAQPIDDCTEAIMALIGPKPLVWREMDEEFLQAVRFPWKFESTNHMFQLYNTDRCWRVMMGSLVIKFDSCETLAAAKAAAQAHSDDLWWGR
ncbi:MAG: hypothetical protein KAT58_02715 [candidate division Zixibacteria bacterium]|nr:hypothetical protein [candidate division Zixibacteria bacterium]